MANQPGLFTVNRVAVAQAVTSSTTLVDVTNFSLPIAVNAKLHIDYSVFFSIGATGGYKFQWLVPAGGASFLHGYEVYDGATPAFVTAAVQSASASFANALAVAGSHILRGSLDIVNGAAAGNVKLQMAQNSSNATPITALVGCFIMGVYMQ